MAFLDNSGDIILDAVLTDTGRMRLARGDGSFRIVKFAFGDDEINYNSYDGNNTSGSAYFDLEILQTPIFEAFTNNTSTMKSKLVSLTNNNLLYLPLIKLNTNTLFTQVTEGSSPSSDFGSGLHVVYVDKDTKDALNNGSTFGGNLDNTPGFINGYQVSTTEAGKYVRVDQGLDTTEISPEFNIDPELRESQYIVELDSRLLRVYDLNGGGLASPSFVDDDLISSYYLTENVGGYVVPMNSGEDPGNGDENIAGPRGTKLRFGLLAALDVVSSDYLFDTIGSEITSGGNSYGFIDTNVRISGVTTGYRVDVPIRVLKQID